jgi:hypothetical protein
MWEEFKEWLSERNWWRIGFWSVGFLQAYQSTISEGILNGILQIVFWLAFMNISQNILLKDMDNGSDTPKWY